MTVEAKQVCDSYALIFYNSFSIIFGLVMYMFLECLQSQNGWQEKDSEMCM